MCQTISYLMSAGLGFQSSRLNVALSISSSPISNQFLRNTQICSFKSVGFILHPSLRPIGWHKRTLNTPEPMTLPIAVLSTAQLFSSQNQNIPAGWVARTVVGGGVPSLM